MAKLGNLTKSIFSTEGKIVPVKSLLKLFTLALSFEYFFIYLLMYLLVNEAEIETNYPVGLTG